jgi:hypothetical protein
LDIQGRRELRVESKLTGDARVCTKILKLPE